ncbi:hypothetical protein NDU88_003326 [Pleurodeles waltl]|uniref:Uncharacterized protein n=1 Tax=Pleurodeles waltl TaxID=8319 RepID=A0AAV7PDI2_PLEWA|nr:hypothetical protein NDU88_003326 [Pleurodeles waltl]
MVYECMPLALLLTQVMAHISKMVGVPLPPDPLSCLQEITTHTKYYLRMVDLVLVLFKHLVAMARKAAQPPTINCWLQATHKWALAEADALASD